MFQKIEAFAKKVFITGKKFIAWIYHSLLMRLWLIIAGLFGVSTASVCPCCGQSAAACPAGFSLLAGLAGILVALGVFQKKAREALRKIFPSLSKSGIRCVFWGLIIAATAVLIVFGYLAVRKPLFQKKWRAKSQQSTPRKQKICKITAAETPVQLAALPKMLEPVKENSDAFPIRMSAVIGPDGSVAINKVTETVLRFRTENFMELNDRLYDRPNAYKDRKVEIEGFVYRRKDFEPGYFVAARLYMWCCAFDATPVGPLCKWDGSDELKDGDWIRAEGTVEPFFFRDSYEDTSGDIPLVKVEKVKRIPKLKDPYVYLGTIKED